MGRVTNLRTGRVTETDGREGASGYGKSRRPPRGPPCLRWDAGIEFAWCEVGCARTAILWGSISPKLLETVRRQLGISDGVLDLAMSKPVLDRAGVMAVTGKLEPRAVAQLMGMRLKGEARFSSRPLHHEIETSRCKRCPAFVDEHERRFGRLPFKSP